MSTQSFTPRLTRPTFNDKYYITKSKNGYSICIIGSPTDSQCNIFSNCVGYALGRFHEIMNDPSFSYYFLNTNAENIFTIAKQHGMKTGEKPNVGALMCWGQGQLFNGADGYGHVAIVERVYSNTHILTSESAYGSKIPFQLHDRELGKGNWGLNGFQFQGFVYNPALITPINKPSEKTRVKGVIIEAASFRKNPSQTSSRIAIICPGEKVEYELGTETIYKNNKNETYTYIKAFYQNQEGWIVKDTIK